MNSNVKLFPAGTYYIGDPCYVINKDWLDVLEQNSYFDDDIQEQKVKGFDVAIGATKHGDGLYSDNFFNEYGVDAGLIGIVPKELIPYVNDDDEAEKMIANGAGYLYYFDKPFSVYIDDGYYEFGNIKIDTEDWDEEFDEDEWNDWDDEDEEWV